MPTWEVIVFYLAQIITLGWLCRTAKISQMYLEDMNAGEELLSDRLEGHWVSYALSEIRPGSHFIQEGSEISEWLLIPGQ